MERRVQRLQFASQYVIYLSINKECKIQLCKHFKMVFPKLFFPICSSTVEYKYDDYVIVYLYVR